MLPDITSIIPDPITHWRYVTFQHIGTQFKTS